MSGWLQMRSLGTGLLLAAAALPSVGSHDSVSCRGLTPAYKQGIRQLLDIWLQP